MASPYPYQKAGVDFLTPRKAALLADEPGLGKTVQAVLAAKNIHDQTRATAASKGDLWFFDALVICPAIACTVWLDHFRYWFTDSRPRLLTGKKTVGSTKFDVGIVTYDKLVADADLLAELGKQVWDVIIADEAHYLKNLGAKRTKAVYQHLFPKAEHFWLLTGTPAPNHVGELWPHLHYAFADTMGAHELEAEAKDRTRFEDTFCHVRDTVYGRQIVGSRNIARLKPILADIMLRRKKADVLTDLPALTFATYPLPRDSIGALPSAFDTVKKSGLPSGVETEDDIFDATVQRETNLAAERRLTGMAKVPAVVRVVDNELSGNHTKLIVFAHHTDVIDELTRLLAEYGPVNITGSSSQKQRDSAVHKFQNDPNTRLFIGQIQAAGTAITLTAASRVFFAEASWVPADNFQAACRAHRIGQKDAVQAFFITVDGTVDDIVSRVLARKSRDLAELFA